MKRVSLLAATLAIVGASLATAQIPSNTVIALSSFVPTNSVFYFDRVNGVSSTVGITILPPVGWGGSCDSIEDSADNQSLVVTDGSGVFIINKATNVVTTVQLNAPGTGFAESGCHGDSGEFYSFHNTGQIWKHDANYANGVLFSSPGGTLNGGCWDGTTGGVATVAWGGGVSFIDRQGTVTGTFGTGVIPTGSGCDWNPFTGEIMISSFGITNANIFSVNRNGTVTPFTSLIGRAEFETNNSIEVRESGPEEYLCDDFGAPPTHLTATDPLSNFTVLNSSPANAYGPSDACYVNSRHVWPIGPWISAPNSVGRLNVSFPARAGQSYALGMSFGHIGVSLGAVGKLHLNISDTLFGISQQGLGLFVNFAGTLDGSGIPTAPVSVNIPAGLGSLGLRVFVAGVTYTTNPFAFTQVSNCCGITIQ